MADNKEKVPVTMYDGAIVMAPRGTAMKEVIRRYYMNKHYDLIEQLEKDNALPQGLLLSLVDKESKFNPKAVSKSNAKGLGQLIERWHPGVDVWDEVANLTRSAEYLAEMQAEFKNWRKTLAGYNQGPTKTRGMIRQLGENWFSHPDIKKETRDYVEFLGPKAEQPTPRVRTGPINPRGAPITSNDSQPQTTNYGSSLGAAPPSLEPTPDKPLNFSFADDLENLSIGLGKGISSQLSGMWDLATDPVGTAKQFWEVAKQVYDDPHILADIASEIGRKVGSGALGIGEVVGEFISPSGVRNAFRMKPQVLEIDAYHVSPYDFDTFKLDKSTSKTGLGGQAWGYGLYAAGELGEQLIGYAGTIAKSIKFAFTKSDGSNASVVSYIRSGQSLPIARSLAKDPDVQDLLDEVRKRLPPERVRNLDNEDLLDDALNSLNPELSIEENVRRFRGIVNNYRLANPEEASRKAYTFRDARADILAGLVTNSELRYEKVNPIFYKVDIPDEDVAKMLKMDVPISEQSEIIAKIQDAASKGDPLSKSILENLPVLESMAKQKGMDFNGFLLYEVAISDAFKALGFGRSAEARSEYLLRLGVPGVIVDSKKPSRNYVIFDPSTIKIQEKVPLNDIFDMDEFAEWFNKPTKKPTKMSKLSPGIYLDEDSGKYFNIGENGSMEELSA